jgi:ABC-type multidrug transport system fused ATPase/permease subunit
MTACFRWSHTACHSRYLKFGLLLHVVLQLYFGTKRQNFKSSKKILLSSILIFSLIGSVLTIMNFYSSADFGDSGSKRFNPFIIIVIWGGILNLVVYVLSYLFLRITQMIKQSIKKEHQHVTLDMTPCLPLVATEHVIPVMTHQSIIRKSLRGVESEL